MHSHSFLMILSGKCLILRLLVSRTELYRFPLFLLHHLDFTLSSQGPVSAFKSNLCMNEASVSDWVRHVEKESCLRKKLNTYHFHSSTYWLKMTQWNVWLIYLYVGGWKSHQICNKYWISNTLSWPFTVDVSPVILNQFQLETYPLMMMMTIITIGIA